MSRSLPMLAFFSVLLLALASCAGGGTTTTSSTTAGGETTSAQSAVGGTVPTEMSSSAIQLTPSQDSGVTGTATLTNTSSGVQVALNVRNLQDQPRTAHLVEIRHGGTCADDQAGNYAPVQYSLNPLMTEQGSTGTSVSAIQGVSVEQIFSGPAKYIDVRANQSGSQTPPSIACADLSSSSSEESTSGTTSQG